MKIGLICPSNLLFMPYVNNYKVILDENNIEYELLIWDRFQIEDQSDEYIYRDSKKGHQRNFIDYIKYKKFLKVKLKQANFDKIIVFGVQLTYFISDILQKKYKNKFIVDIRDYNKILNFFNLKRTFSNAYHIVLSSPGYKKWLPENNKYIINHNTLVKNLDEIEPSKTNNSKSEIKIASIGALRDLGINKEFINALKDSSSVSLLYHGEGTINNDIKQYLSDHKITNVSLTGRYKPEDEPILYKDKNFINVLRYNNGINNQTALPNRLYNAAFHGIPVLAFEGTYLAQIVKMYNLGLVLNSFQDIERTIYDYLNSYDEERYTRGREIFFQKVIDENSIFFERIMKFINEV